MRRIAIVTPILPVPWDRTRGWPVYQTLRALAARAQLRVFFLTARYPPLRQLQPAGFAAQRLPPGYRLEGLDLQVIEYPALAGLSRPVNGAVGAMALHRPVREFAPELVLAYWIYPEGASALRVARRLGVPFVVGARGSDIRVRDTWSRILTGRVLRAADAVLTVSDELRVQATQRYGADAERVHCVINGCDTALFHHRDRTACRSELGLAADGRVLVYVGRLVEAKGLRELVAAFAALAPQIPELRLALVGDGVFRAALESLVDAHRIADRTLMPGAVEPATVARWIGAADVLVLPSYSEGYPNVLVEALACGVPVVATDVGGAREIVDADSGALVPPRDVAGLVAGLREVLDRRWDPVALSSRFARSWDDVAGDTLAVCEDAMAARVAPHSA